MGGGGIIISFPYIFLLVDCFKWALIDCIQKWRVYSELWQFQMGGIIVSFTQVNLTIWAHFALASQADLPGRAENLRNVNCSCCGSVVLGGHIIRFIWCHTDIALYLPISWLFRMGAHWLHWKVKSSLWALAVSQGGSICLWYLHVCSIHWYFLISSYYLTVLHGHLLTVLKRIEFTQCSGSFEWGVHQPLVFTCFLYALVFPDIFLLFDCFEWALIGDIG